MRSRARRAGLGCGAALLCALLAAGTFAWSVGLVGGPDSPVGGYLEAEDLAVVLDTNESYHGPWLVDVDRLFLGVHEVDRASGRPRGLVVATLPN